MVQGWEIFQAFEKHCRLPGGGFASIYDVDQVPVVHEDRMETFWIAETVRSRLRCPFKDPTDDARNTAQVPLPPLQRGVPYSFERIDRKSVV